MSAFFEGDLCTFKADPAIIGIVKCTWSDRHSTEYSSTCYVHKDLPLYVRNAYFNDAKLLLGYVTFAFNEPYHGHCLSAETSLRLVDRSFVLGKVVKKRLTDTQSGRVLSTSILCSLQPKCSRMEFLRQDHPPVQGHTPSHGPHAPKGARKDVAGPSTKLIHGFPASSYPELNRLVDSDAAASGILQAPASELKFFRNYREDDYLIYKGWIGLIKTVYNEVLVRLANGTIVIVENPKELEKPCWIAGSPSHELVKRLDRAGYYRFGPAKNDPDVGKPLLITAEPCYPGQPVQTKKGNLRCGSWKFGAYDSNVTTRGMVVDVRSTQIEVRWLSLIVPQKAPATPPLTLLDTEELETGGAFVYDWNKLPNQPIGSTLADASHSQDIGFGHKVRFRDPFGAAVKYGSVSAGATPRLMPTFDRIPRGATQGFDMNVLEVVATSTKVMVRWQDCSVTEEESIQLLPYLDPDDDDVWPGDMISSISDEEKLGNDVPIIRLHKVGVVQSVDARERIARVRWFEGTEIDVDEEKKASRYSSPKYGKLCDEIVNVLLYDIAAYEALALCRGDLVTIAPEPALSQAHFATGQDHGSSVPIDPDEDAVMQQAPSDSLPISTVSRRLLPNNPGSMLASAQRARTFLGFAADVSNSTVRDVSPSPDTEMVGEVTDLCLDGEILVRLGAASEVREIKVPIERATVVEFFHMSDSEDSDESDQDGDSFSGNAMSISDEDTGYETDQGSVMAVDVSIKYEGGEKLNDGDDDDEMWAIDKEDVDAINKQMSSDHENQREQHLNITDVQPDSGVVLEPQSTSSNANATGTFSRYPSMPPCFSVLEGEAPSDHHFFTSSRPSTSDFMRRIMKEHQIMQSNLPDGIFVRTWESRLDLLRVLIVGPLDTPYEFAPFVVDLHFGLNFPTSSPEAYFHSWTGGLGRINPNLYENGKVCLSLLGTWDADERNEEWSPKKSSVLQVLVSLMGLVLVKEPYYNEVGFHVFIGSVESQVPSAQYSEKAFAMSKGFIKTALTSPPHGLADIIKWLYLSSQPGPRLLSRVLDDAKKCLDHTTPTASAVGSASDRNEEMGLARTKLSTAASILLKRHVDSLIYIMKTDNDKDTATNHTQV